MRRKYRWPSILAGIILGSLVTCSIAGAADEALLLTVRPAMPGGTTSATLGIENVADIEAFSLELSFASGSSLALQQTGWFSRNAFFPSSPFGVVPQVDLNDVHVATAGQKIYISGFKPTGSSGSIGVINFQVNSSAVQGDGQVLALTGQFYSRAGQIVKSFAPVSITFMTGSYPKIGVSPSSKSFGYNPGAGYTSAPQTFTISNTGSANLVIGTITKGGANAGEFIKQNDLCSSTTVAPSGSCAFEIVFSSASTGAKYSTISIPSNDPDLATIALRATDTQQAAIPGDIDGDGTVTLSDAILILKMLAGKSIGQQSWTNADINNDNKIGLSEAIYILQKVGGLR